MKLTQPMQDALHKLDGHQMRGNTINTGERLHIIHWNTVKSLYNKGLIAFIGEHCWGTQYSAQGKVIERYTVGVYELSDTGKSALQLARLEQGEKK